MSFLDPFFDRVSLGDEYCFKYADDINVAIHELEDLYNFEKRELGGVIWSFIESRRMYLIPHVQTGGKIRDFFFDLLLDGNKVSWDKLRDYVDSFRFHDYKRKRKAIKALKKIAEIELRYREEHDKEIKRAKYHEYLKSPEWEKKRRLVLARAGGKCEGCLVADATEVHHLTYKRVFKEMLFDLVAICRDCHEQIHEVAE